MASPGAQGPSLVLDAKGRPRFSFSADDGTSVARHTASGWRQRRVWSDGSDSQLLLAAGDQTRLVGLRETLRPQAWFAAWSSGAWQRTRLTSHPTRQVAFAIEKADASRPRRHRHRGSALVHVQPLSNGAPIRRRRWGLRPPSGACRGDRSVSISSRRADPAPASSSWQRWWPCRGPASDSRGRPTRGRLARTRPRPHRTRSAP